MTLDDVYGAYADAFPLEQDAANWEETELDWDDEALALAGEISRRATGH